MQVFPETIHGLLVCRGQKVFLTTRNRRSLTLTERFDVRLPGAVNPRGVLVRALGSRQALVRHRVAIVALEPADAAVVEAVSAGDTAVVGSTPHREAFQLCLKTRSDEQLISDNKQLRFLKSGVREYFSPQNKSGRKLTVIHLV